MIDIIRVGEKFSDSEAIISIFFPIKQPDGIHDVQDALLHLTKSEPLEGFTTSKGLVVEATKQVLLQNVPPILILHLKRFLFDSGMIGKIQKHITYPLILNLPNCKNDNNHKEERKVGDDKCA